MKNKLFFLFILLFTSCTIKNEVSQPEINSFAQLKKLFKTPPVNYRSVPFWVWNDDITEKQINEQLTDFKDKGIGGVFIHPRPGLITPYLSDRWHSLFRYSVDKAKELGMQVWIYDENSYPSGFAGGHVPAEMPESYNQGQGLVLKKMNKFPEKIEKEYHLILKKESEEYVDITNNYTSEKGKKGDYYFFELKYYKKSKWYGGYSYVDLLLEDITEKFIEITMQGYKESSGYEFGKAVPGVFTDEPNIASPDGIRWTPSLFSKFQERWGYDLKTTLPSLFYEVGDWKRIRHNYYFLLLELFIERWSKPWYNYCEKNNLKWTGHYWEHGWPKPGHGGDNMAMYAWHQVPGIDILMNQYSESVDAQFGNVRAVKELISAANQTGRTRTLSETYGAAGWDLRFEDMKRIADWQYVLGVNFLNQHLSYVTIKGARKRDHPPSFSYHEPWWKLYRTLGDYCARMSLAISAGSQNNTTLVLEPTTTAWMYFSKEQPNKKFTDLGQLFQDFIFNLEKNQLEYDLGSENIIRNFGKVEKGKFLVGEKAYNLVVLPPTFENLDKYTAELLEQFLVKGGFILSFNNVPKYIDGSETEKITGLAEQFSDQWINVESIDEKEALERLSSASFKVLEPEKIKGKLFHHRRELKDGELLLFINASLDEWSTVTFHIKGKSVVELNPVNGEIIHCPAKVNDKKLEISFDLPPVGELLLFIDHSKTKVLTKNKEEPKVRSLTPAKELMIERIAPNMLVLDYCDIKLDNGEEEKDIYFFNAAEKIYRYYGLNGNPWARAVQYKTDILDRDSFPENSGFAATYLLDVCDGLDKSGLRAVIERAKLWKLSVNGYYIEPLPGEFWLDKAFGVYDISNYIKTGINEITLIASPMTIHSELEPIYILGEFGLKSQKKGWKLVPPKPIELGSWNTQEMPLYSDGISYTKLYKFSGNNKNYIIHLPNWRGSVAEVLVNNKQAGIIGWPPYELDITDFVSDEDNKISVIVYGTLKNLLGPHHHNPPRGAAWPSQFESAPEHQPPGNTYDVIEYGLFDDFKVIESDRRSEK